MVEQIYLLLKGHNSEYTGWLVLSKLARVQLMHLGSEELQLLE